MQVKDLGEFGVIDMLNRMVVSQRSGPDNGAPLSFSLLVDTGDDTAVWESHGRFNMEELVVGVVFDVADLQARLCRNPPRLAIGPSCHMILDDP